jgi:hypothetical protein
MAYVRAVVATAGFNFGGPELDRNGDDLYIEHKECDGFVPKYPRLIVQVKCTYAHSVSRDSTIHYPLLIRNYDHLRRIQIEPRILIVVHVPRPDSALEPWIECLSEHTIFRYHAYWMNLMGAPAVVNDEKVTVNVPTSNVFDVKAVHRLMNEMVAQGNKQL